MKARTILVAVAVFAIAVAAGPASAEGDWQYTIAPTVLGSAMDGWVQVDGQAVEVNAPFSKIWSNLQFGAMVHFDMKNDRWLLYGEFTSMDLKQDGEFEDLAAKVDVKQTLFEVAGGYRIAPSVTLLAGARFVDLSAKHEFSGAHAGLNRDGSKSWVDPLVGINLTLTFSERWKLDTHLDAGGFGVGADQAWHEYANICFKASDSVSVFVGYQALDMEYQSDNGPIRFRYDVLSSGPQAGVAFHF